MAAAGESDPVTTAPNRDLNALWLPLLRKLTDAHRSWGLWKNADSALEGHGDFDSTAPASLWSDITATFSEWATDNGYGPVAACRHVPGVLFLIALDEERSTFLELDVNARKYFRGWTVFRPEDLAPLMEIDERGFRRVRPGAEGVILLTQNGLKWGGRPDREGLRRKRVAEMLRSDPSGAHRAAELFGLARRPLERGIRRVAEGSWDRPAMLAVEARAVAGALREPSILLTRLQARRVKRLCPMLTTIFSEQRRISGDPHRWMASVAEGHEVHGVGRRSA